MQTVYNILLVFLGSGIGGVCRWGISMAMNKQLPLGTLLVNILGCFAIGLLSRIIPANDQMRLLLIAGFCGGFTTYSTFINENFLMLRGSQLLLSIGYMAISIIVGLLAAWAGSNIVSD